MYVILKQFGENGGNILFLLAPASLEENKIIFLRQIILKSWKSNYKWNGAKWYSSKSELRVWVLILYYMRGKTENFEEM